MGRDHFLIDEFNKESSQLRTCCNKHGIVLSDEYFTKEHAERVHLQEQWVLCRDNKGPIPMVSVHSTIEKHNKKVQEESLTKFSHILE
jgi:hypothetical protein